MSTTIASAILPATRNQAAEYADIFVNRRIYVQQSHAPNPKSGRHYFYKVCDRKKQPIGLTRATVQSHLAGDCTIGFYAINPETQCSKWIAIDADYADSLQDLLQLQQAFRADGIESLMEQSRRGGHLWIFLAEPLPAVLCRLYVLNIAHVLSIAIKQDKKDGLEVFPRQNFLQPGEFGNAIRCPLGIHRASQLRYWFEDAAPNLDAQLQLLREVPRLGREQLESLTAGLSPVEDDPVVVASAPAPLSVLAVASVHQPNYLGSSKRPHFDILRSLTTPMRREGMEYKGQCPSCASMGLDPKKHYLKVNIANPDLYRCFGAVRCSKEMIREALGCPVPVRSQFA
jgi:hypothetical protein